MKRFPVFWTAGAVAIVLAASTALPSEAQAQAGPVVNAQPDQRNLVPLPPADQQGIPLSLSQAVAIAVQNNQDQWVSVNAAKSFDYLIVENKGIYDPLISAAFTRSHAEIPAASSFQAGIFDDTQFSANVSQLMPTGGTVQLGFTGLRESTNNPFTTVNPSYSSTGTLSLNQPLLRNFGSFPTNWQIYIAKNTRDGAYQTLLRSIQSTVNTVEQAYWDLVYAVQNLEVKKESLRIAQDLNRITRIKIDVGSLAPIDVVQTEVGIATAEQDIITAEGLIGDAQDRLRRQLNFDPLDPRVASLVTTPINPTDRLSTEEVKIQLDVATTTALKRRPEVVTNAYVAANDLIRYQYYKNQMLPSLNLVGSYGARGLAGTTTATSPGTLSEASAVTIQSAWGDAFNDVFNNHNKNWSIGLNFSYPILNRGAKGAAGVARYNYESDKATVTATQENVIVEVRAAARAIDTAQRSIVAAVKGRELAERNLDAEKKKFDNGMSTTFQVNQIQRDLSAARTLEQQALAIYRKAVAQFHFAVSDNLEWKGIRVEGLPEAQPPVTDLEPPLQPMPPRAPQK
jgi:outer membrane protein TolC